MLLNQSFYRVKIAMKKRLVLLLALLVLTSCSHGSNDDSQQAIQSALSAEWQSYTLAHPNWGGGMALLISTPRGNYFAAEGFPAGAPVSEALHFRGASTTKTFTAAAIMLLHQRGHLHIDHVLTDPIPGTAQPYLPNAADYAIPNKHQITIRQLLQHRGGVFDITNQSIPPEAPAPYAGKMYLDYVREELGDDAHTFTFDEIARVVSVNNLYHSFPGQGFHYSNTGFALLGKIIERVSGKGFDEFVRDELLLPLALDATSFPRLGTDQTIPPPFAAGFTWSSGLLYPTTLDNMSGSVAEGNVITSLTDLSRWNRLLLMGKAGIDAALAAEMMSCLPTYEEHQFYGLGIEFTPGLGYGHNGGHMGYMTVTRYDPETQVTVTLFAAVINADDMYGQLDWMYDLARNAKRLLGY